MVPITYELFEMNFEEPNFMKSSPEMMQIILKLVEKHKYDLSKPGKPLKLELPGHDPLYICCVGKYLVLVAHYYESEGNRIPDPAVVFYVGYTDMWIPVSMENEIAFIEACKLNPDRSGI